MENDEYKEDVAKVEATAQKIQDEWLEKDKVKRKVLIDKWPSGIQ